MVIRLPVVLQIVVPFFLISQIKSAPVGAVFAYAQHLFIVPSCVAITSFVYCPRGYGCAKAKGKNEIPHN